MSCVEKVFELHLPLNMLDDMIGIILLHDIGWQADTVSYY